MCGRFNLTADGEEIAEAFDLETVPELAPRFNIAPSQPIAAIGVQPRTGRRGLTQLLWGLAPKAVPLSRRQINARAETAGRTPAFRDAFAHRRCLIPAPGFYEWQPSAGARRPWLLRMANGAVFAFAGIWEPPESPGEVASCAILTTEPNELARRVHDRMPAILDPADYAAWLDPSVTSSVRLAPLLRPFPSGAMTAFPVSAAVNNPAFDDPSCVLPASEDSPPAGG